MTLSTHAAAALLLVLVAVVSPARGQAPAGAPAKQDFLVVYFDEGSATVRPADLPVLDQASRTYREGQPIVMILSGSTDSVGSPITNLVLSQRRADAVLQALVARGIPAARFQILAKGETEPAVPGQAGQPEPRDRRVEIAWR